MKTKPSKLTLSKETLKNIKTSVRAGATTHVPACPGTFHTCASFDRC
jgi:hypothetical protein